MAIKIVDTTLRDGEQTPGIAFGIDEKIKIAEMLDRLGVDCIEVGTPAVGRQEQRAIQEVIRLGLRAEIITWNRAIREDIEKSLACGSKNLHISLPVSDIQITHKIRRSRGWVLKQLEQICDCLRKKEKVTFSVGAEDASRADPEFLLEYAALAEKSGADRLRYCDTVGMLNPFSLHTVYGFTTSQLLQHLSQYFRNSAQIRYELAKLRARKIIDKQKSKSFYRVTKQGWKWLWATISANVYFRNPIISKGYKKELSKTCSQPSKLEEAYSLIDSGLTQLTQELALAA